MDFLRKARDLESRLAGTLDRTVGGLVRPVMREPLEIVHAVLAAVQEEIQASGRGRRVFPFNAIALTVLAPSRDARARFESVFADRLSLRDRIVASLGSAACQVDDLDVSVAYEAKPRKHWRNPAFHVDFSRVAKRARSAPEPTRAPAVPRVELTVLKGTAEQETYTLDAAIRVDIGRCAEVRDSRHRLVRTNHVAFLERSGGANQTVSRRHAHISYEPDGRGFRVLDDGSEHGTGIVRHGRTLAVPRGARGVRLELDDEIVLGEARLRVRFG